MNDTPVKPVEAASFDYEVNKVDSNSVGQMNHIDVSALYRKIDWRIVPLMFLCYLYEDSCYAFCVILLT
jgi:hypothetical protein